MIVWPTSGDWSHFDLSRRRRWHESSSSPAGSDVSSESAPLDHSPSNASSIINNNYSTFSSSSPEQRQVASKESDFCNHPAYHHHDWWWRWLLSRQSPSSRKKSLSLLAIGVAELPPPRPSLRPYPHHPYYYYHVSPLGCSWRVLYVTLLFTGLLAFYFQYHHQQDDGTFTTGDRRHYYTKATAEWDHNIYSPVMATSSSNSPHAHFLLAQLSVDGLTDISSRPNRAYARTKGMDYVQYAQGRHIDKACFDKIALLNMIMDKQQQQQDHDNNHHHPPGILSPLLTSLPTRVEYDAVALLPPDAIVTNLDSSIFDALPQDKLVAIAGWTNHNTDNHDVEITSQTGIVFFNLRHPYAHAVAKRWWDLVVEPFGMSCGAGNDLALLVDAIASVTTTATDAEAIMEPLKERRNGFVSIPVGGDRPSQEDMMRGIVLPTPGNRVEGLLKERANVQVQLQTTADSVCYRFYPKCDVL